MMDLVRSENQWSRPRSSEIEANTASRMAGTTAMTLNRLTMRTWSWAPAVCLLRASQSPVTCQAMMPTIASTSTRLIKSMPTTTMWVGTIGVSPVRMT